MKVFLKLTIYKPNLNGGSTLILDRGIHEATLTDDGEYAQIPGSGGLSVHKSIFEILPMTHLSHDICLRLRDAGLPQPELDRMQFWYNDSDLHFSGRPNTGLKLDREYINPQMDSWVFHPDAEYLLAHLPPGYVIQKHKGHYHFGDQYAVFNLSSPFIAEAAPTAVMAAANLYLAIHEKTPSKKSIINKKTPPHLQKPQ